MDRALVPDEMTILGRLRSLQIEDHTLIDVPLSNVYLDPPAYYRGYCRGRALHHIPCDNW